MKTPYLIQRGTFNQPLVDKTCRLSQAVRFDYMGSAEFEFGALPESFLRIGEKMEQYQTSKTEIVLTRTQFVGRDPVGIEEFNLFLFSAYSETEIVEYCKHISDIISNKIQLKERAAMKDQNFNFWWDIENDVMFFIGKKPYVKRVETWVRNSIEYMAANQ